MAAIAERSHAATLTLRAALARPVTASRLASPVPPGGYRPTPFGVDRHSFIPVSERGLLLANSLLRSTAGVAAARASRSKLSARSARRRDRGVGWGTGAPGIGVDPVWWTFFSRSTSPIGGVLAAVK